MSFSNLVSRVFVSTGPIRNNRGAYLKSLLLVGLVTAVGFLLDLRVAATNQAMLYLAVVVFSALKWGVLPAVLSSIVSTFLFDYIFIPPYLSFAITDVWYFITLVVMIGVGILASVLAGAAREQMLAAKEQAAHMAALYSVTKLLSPTRTTEEVLRAAASHIQETFGRPVAIMLCDENQRFSTRFQTPGLELDQRTSDLARTLLQESALAPTARAEGVFVPLKIGTQIIGLVALLPTQPGNQLTERQQEVLTGEANQVALAIKRAFLEDRAREADHLEREQAQSRAAKAEAITALAGGLAHNLNNILTGVLGNVSLASDLLGECHPATRRLREATAAAQRAAAVVSQMLAYAGKGRFVDVDVDISQAVREFVRAIGDSIPGNIHLETHLGSGIPAIRADPNQIRQVIGNLYFNAVEAIGDKDGTVIIAAGVERIEEGSGELTRTLPPGDYICLRVSDTGSGIDEEIRPKIFDPFFTTKLLGRGLGLPAAAGIMRAHGGAIGVSGQPGGGSTFTCLFPIGSR